MSCLIAVMVTHRPRMAALTRNVRAVLIGLASLHCTQTGESAAGLGVADQPALMHIHGTPASRF